MWEHFPEEKEKKTTQPPTVVSTLAMPTGTGGVGGGGKSWTRASKFETLGLFV
jgi:hypothetical protein